MEEGLNGGGEMLARIRAFDWTRTPLGPPEHWPQSLKTAVSICLDSRFPVIVRWGEELITLYNDAYIPMLGHKHPGALGSPGLSRAPGGDLESRAVIEPMLRGVLTRGEATWSTDQLFILERHGFAEETYFTFSSSPIRVEAGAVGGVFTAVSETTQTVVGERRLRALEKLSARLSEVTTVTGLYAAALAVLDSVSHEVPFCLLYTLDATGTTATLAGVNGALADEAAPRRFAVLAPDAPWPVARAWPRALDVEPARLGAWAQRLPGGPWPEPARKVLVLPLRPPDEKQPAGFLIAGTSPRLMFDENYRGFLLQVAERLVHALVRVRALEDERQRSVADGFSDAREHPPRPPREGEKFRSFVLNVPGAVYECSPEPPWRFHFMSEPVFALTGHSASEFLAGLTWAPLIHPEDLAFVKERLSRAVERHVPYELEYRILHTDGSPRWVSEVGRALYDDVGRAHCLEGILFDITARKATEETLQRYQRQVTRTLADNATSALYLTDGEGRCTYMNPAAERMTGHVFAEVEGRPLHAFVHPSWGAAVCTPTCALERLLTGRESRSSMHEDEFARVTGEPLPVAVAASPLLHEGQYVGTVLEARDLTEQKRAEAALREAQHRKDEFLAMLAHELRNPMAPLRAALKLLEARTALDDKGRHAIGIIERQTTHLARLVDELLDVSRITRGRIELRKTLVELPAVVESALQSVQHLLDERRHEVSVTLPRDPLRTLGDGMRIEQIIVNLLTNAAKYTEPGGTLRVDLERMGAKAEIRVKDTGIGLSPELIGRVFNLFEQAERPLDRSQGGLGIGLTLVKNLVELHAGTIEARSEGLGRGSEFIVRLPLAEEPTEAEHRPEPRGEPARPGGRRILVVDDNLDAADTLAELLQTWEYTVWQAHDGLAALKAVEEHRPDIVLLDIGLPGMDGYEVARQLRAGPLGPGLTLVALTGYGQASDRSRALEAGFDRHFVKPVDIDGLQKFIEQQPPRA